MVVAPALVSGTTYLQYFSIPTQNPFNPSGAHQVSSQGYTAISSVPGWDGVALNSSSDNTLVIAFNSTVGGQGVHLVSLDSQQIALNQSSSVIHSFTNASYIGAIVGVCADTSVSPRIVYFSFYNNATSVVYTGAVYIGFGTITQQFAPTSMNQSCFDLISNLITMKMF